MYGADDRREYFQTAPALQPLSESVVAFIPRSALTPDGAGIAGEVQSLGQRERLCAGERYAEQPAAGFCSGILVEEDLVLTAGHCVHGPPLRDFVVVFDYFYTAPGQLAFDAGDVYEPVAVESQALPLPEDELRLDYAWVRLGRPASGRVARVDGQAPALVRGAPLAVVSAGGGIPLKWDTGGMVRDTHTCAADFFTLDSDTLRGSSGGAAFDESLALRGIMVRGERDWDWHRGCFTSHRDDDPDAIGEEFLSARRAIEGLCASGSPRPLCASSARAEPCREHHDSSGCTASRHTRVSGCASLSALASFLMALLMRRRSTRPRKFYG